MQLSGFFARRGGELGVLTGRHAERRLDGNARGGDCAVVPGVFKRAAVFGRRGKKVLFFLLSDAADQSVRRVCHAVRPRDRLPPDKAETKNTAPAPIRKIKSPASRFVNIKSE